MKHLLLNLEVPKFLKEQFKAFKAHIIELQRIPKRYIFDPSQIREDPFIENTPLPRSLIPPDEKRRD